MKNKYRIDGNVTAIYLKRKDGYLVTLIDTNNLPKAEQLINNWYACKCSKSGNFYVEGTVEHTTVLLHRFLLDAPEGMVVDHINHNTLDNRKSNLRILTHAENHQNRKGAMKNSKTGIRGIRLDKGLWKAEVRVNGKLLNRSFTSKTEATQFVKKLRETVMPYSSEATNSRNKK